MLQSIVLFCIDRFNGERSLAAIHHLLNGKKTAQTLQDCQWYRVGRLFGTLFIERERLASVVAELQEKRLVTQVSEQTYCATAEGKALIQSFTIPRYVNGWKFMNEASLFWKRLSLLVQTVSNLCHRKSFEPIQRNDAVQIFVKRWLFQHKRVTAIARALYVELYALLERVDERDANVFAWRLTTHERIGLTEEQIAHITQEDEVRVHFRFLNVLHLLLQATEEERNDFPLLHSLRNGEKVTLTTSAKQTYDLLQQGKTIEQIAHIRQLKRATIEDHVVEIATALPHFSIVPFLSEEKRVRIVQKANELKTKKLRAVKEAIPDASYFEIRLAFARWEGKDA